MKTTKDKRDRYKQYTESRILLIGETNVDRFVLDLIHDFDELREDIYVIDEITQMLDVELTNLMKSLSDEQIDNHPNITNLMDKLIFNVNSIKKMLNR